MTPEAERTRAALDGLVEVLQRAEGEVRSLAEHARSRRAQLRQGVLLRDLVVGATEPLVIQRVTDLLEVIADAGAELRRAEAVQLRSEGLTQAEIAEVYGVTRQRVGALLATPSARPD